MFVKYAQDGSIEASAAFEFPGSQKVDFQVERGYDGKLYKAGTAPVKPAAEVEAEAFAALRAERDSKLAETDYLIMSDYPISSEKLEAVKAYRQALRDLPQQKGAPWVGKDIPWPVAPEGE